MQALADAIDEMVANLEQEFGVARHTDLRVDEVAMLIKEPVEPIFPVGAMGFGYDASRDRILLVARKRWQKAKNTIRWRCGASPRVPRCRCSASTPGM